MFNLEPSIAAWRNQMLAAGLRSPVPLDELELHLREEIERQLRSGLDEAQAFETSVQQIGQPKPLKSEFNKTERSFMNRKLSLLVGIFILLLGTTMILPALGKHKQRNQPALAAGAKFFAIKWAGDEVYGLELGTAFAICGLATTAYGLKRRKA